MKTIVSVLILLVALHSQCGAQCLGADSSAPAHPAASMPEQSPCHAGSPQTPAPGQAPGHHNHENGNACEQLQTLESRIGPISKCVFDCAALEPVTFHPISFQIVFAIPGAIETNSDAADLSPNHFPILRI